VFAEAMVIVMTSFSRRATNINSYTLWRACQMFAHFGGQVVWDLPWTVFEQYHKVGVSAWMMIPCSFTVSPGDWLGLLAPSCTSFSRVSCRIAQLRHL
jgi:hypothetical protein